MAAIEIGDIRDSSVGVSNTEGVERARRLVREFAEKAGLAPQAIEELVLATSELAGNLWRHATAGEVACGLHHANEHTAVEVRCTDNGPGIPNLQQAMRDGFSTNGGLGGGLSSARDLTDEFLIESTPMATSVRIRKWLPRS